MFMSTQIKKTISVCRELIPVGKTRQNIDKYSAMADDELIYENNHLIKALIKKMAPEKIEGALDGIKSELDFSELFALMDELEKKQGEERNEIMQKIFAERIAILNELSAAFDFKFEKKNTIDSMLPKYIETHRIKNKDELMQMMEVVKARQSKFAKFEKNIDTLLNMNLKKGTLSYRILLVTMTEIIEYS